MNRHVVMGQLLGMRSQLDALIQDLADEPEPKGPNCAHPEERRKYLGGMGNVTGFSCEQCGASVPYVENGNNIGDRAVGRTP